MSEVGTKTKILLWGKAAAKCSICKIDLVMDSTQTDDESLIGEVCHINAHNDGARVNLSLTEEQKNKYSNLILLCRNHHKQVDDQENDYTAERLLQIKSDHEEWVKSHLDLQQRTRQRNLEIYADYIDHWKQYFLVDEWKRWTNFLLQPTPLFLKEDYDSVKLGKEWLFRRIWSNEIPDLERVFINFFKVARDLLIVFDEFTDERSNEDILRVRAIYKIDKYDPELYNELHNQFEFHVDFIFDLVAELTRAANLICDTIRNTIDPTFMLDKGRLVIEEGLNMNLQYVSSIPLYAKEDLGNLYVDIKDFAETRFGRDFHFALERHRGFSELRYVSKD
jgi:5-methylcytosine-specific restriction endonuclease McrA